MPFDKKEIILGIGGILASSAVAFLIYRLQKNDSTQANSQAATDAASQIASEQYQIASLPSVSVPSLATTSVTDTTQQATAPASDSDLASLIAGFQASDQTDVTTRSNPIGAIPILSFPTLSSSLGITLPSDSTTIDPNTEQTTTTVEASGAPIAPINRANSNLKNITVETQLSSQ